MFSSVANSNWWRTICVIMREEIYTILLTLFVIFIMLYIAYWFKNQLRFRKIMNEFPGRKCNPVFGDVLNFTLQQDAIFEKFRDYAQEFPDGYRMYGGQYGIINLLLAEDIETVLSSPRHIEKTRIYEVLQQWLGTGLLTSGAKKWAHRRKILTPAFHFNILRRFIAVFNAQSEKFIEKLREESNKAHTDIVPILSTLTLNIICETAMGISSVANDVNMREYQKAVHRLGSLLVHRVFRPWLYSDFIYGFTSYGRQQNKLLNTLHQFTMKVIKAREKAFNESDAKNIENSDEDHTGIYAKNYAMLDLLLLAKKQGKIDDHGIAEEVDTFMFGGHDTISTSLSFCVFALANHKHIQEKARTEIDEIFRESSRPANYQDLQNMKYLEMVIKESLRLYPSVPLILRQINEDIPIRNGKYTIPKGSFVHMWIYDLHRNSKVFPDPEKFDPDRFLPENVKGRHPYAYIPFSAGPRNCIGQKFALLEMKCILASILRHYEIEPIDTRENLKMIFDLVLRPANEIRVKFISRSK